MKKRIVVTAVSALLLAVAGGWCFEGISHAAGPLSPSVGVAGPASR